MVTNVTRRCLAFQSFSLRKGKDNGDPINLVVAKAMLLASLHQIPSHDIKSFREIYPEDIA